MFGDVHGDDEMFCMSHGLLAAERLSFSERLRQARQLDSLLESFDDDEEEASALDQAQSNWLQSSWLEVEPRATIAVAASRPDEDRKSTRLNSSH